MKKMTSLLSVTLSIILLAACSGWHLRGTQDTLQMQQSIYLANGSGSVHQYIQQSLEKKQALADITSANIQLALGKEYADRRTITIDNNANTRQYQLTLSVSYEILDRTGKPLTKSTSAKITRYYTFNENAINSSDKEEQSLKQQMVRQLSQQILRRVNFLINNNTTAQPTR